MINIKLKKINYLVITTIILFFLYSITTIYSISTKPYTLLTKQVTWYILGFIILIIISKININKLIDNNKYLYIFMNILLLLLLFFGTEINGSKCWFNFFNIISFEPSEFMKIALIIMNANIINWYDTKYKNKNIKTDLILFTLILISTLIPSILTFLEPDTGMVIIYFLISFIMLFIYGIKLSIFVILSIIIIIFLGIFIFIYTNYQDTFINIFGTSFFYRIDRLINWSNKSGMQITNALAAIKSAYIFGFGIKNTPIYIPESHTDFIFSVYASNFGLVGSLLLIITIIIFDISLLYIYNKTSNNRLKYITSGFLGMILFQQIENIGMNIGILPITGITLPFISYGGSSLLSNIIILSIILNLFNVNQKNKY